MSTNKAGYTSALDFIMRRELFGIKLGLENITRFLNRIGNPQFKFPAVHIAGTNGKGSTAAYIESILRRAGYRTGIFTSPHLVDYRERIRVNGEQVEKDFIVEFVKKYRRTISRNKITFFETCTALAFTYFAEKKIDIAIVEVGLGGRLDATSVLKPILSVITDISYDHTTILGETLTKIAFEKAGIIKENTPVLTGVLKKEPLKEIMRVSRQRSAPIDVLKKSHFSEIGRDDFFDFHNNGQSISKLRTSLGGRHQIYNGSLAVRAAILMKDMGYNIKISDIRQGLKKTHWPGRFQMVKKTGQPLIILDVGHNPAGIKALVDHFKDLYPGRKAEIVIGFVRGKDLKKSVGYIKNIAGRAEIVRLNTHRTADPEEIASYFGRKKDMVISDSVTDSAQKLVNTANPDDIIIICGSHYAVGEFLANQNKIYDSRKKEQT